MTVLKVIKLLDDRGEEWTVPVAALTEAVRAGLERVTKGYEAVAVERIEVITGEQDWVKIQVTLRTSLLFVGGQAVPET